MLRVRPATITDLDFIVSGNLELALETEGLVLNASILREGVGAILGDSEVPGAYWIAELDDVVVGQLMITFEWSDWRNRMIWWIQSVYVSPTARHHGVFRALYLHVRGEARSAGAGGLRLYVDTTNARAQQVYATLGMNGDHYRVFEDMF